MSCNTVVSILLFTSLMAFGCTREPERQTRLSGEYAGDLAAASSAGRTITLSLFEDGRANLSTDYQDGSRIIIESGTWKETGAGFLELLLTDIDGRRIDERILFGIHGDGLNAVEYDVTKYGTKGLALRKRR